MKSGQVLKLPSQPSAPTKDFMERLTSYDDMLRVKWGHQLGEWRIERKIRRSYYIPPELFSNQDDYQCAKDGYCLVLSLLPNQLDDRVFYTLWCGDIQAQGGANRVADKMDADYFARYEKGKRQTGERLEDAARERYDYMNRVRTVTEDKCHTAPKGGMSIMGGTR